MPDAAETTADRWAVEPQVIEDPVTGLTFTLEVREHAPYTRYALHVSGPGITGTREILFDAEGRQVAAGTSLVSACRPPMLHVVR